MQKNFKIVLLTISFASYSFCSENSENIKDKIEEMSNKINCYSQAITNNRISLENFLNDPITKEQLPEDTQVILRRMQFNAEELLKHIQALFNLFINKQDHVK